LPNITFHGAAGTVTGSRHLLQIDGKNILVDCGMFQGHRNLRLLNWAPFPVDPKEIDAVVITHAHTDHIGYLPRLVAMGYHGPIYATPATIRLARISLPDSARVQEDDARTANKVGSRHKPALPLYTEEQAYAALKHFEAVPYHELKALPGGAQFRYHPAGHILGSAFAEIFFESGERILMGGDLGRYDTPIIGDPASMDYAEYLVIEGTYGNRRHSSEDPMDKLEEILLRAWQEGSAVLVPSFAIGRTQELLYYLRRLQDERRLPRIPIFIDSPMATAVTDVYARSPEEHDEDMRLSVEQGRSQLQPEGLFFLRDRNQSRELNSRPGPFILISGSGMANGGRIVHHLLHRLKDPSTTVLFTGFQAEGTLGRRILEGEKVVRVLKQEVHVRARVEKLNALSAHADQDEMMRWLGHFKQAPRQTFVVHGEPPALEAMAERIRTDLGWSVAVPSLGESFDL
jgi:metallo-beta-lactamase family protein